MKLNELDLAGALRNDLREQDRLIGVAQTDGGLGVTLNGKYYIKLADAVRPSIVAILNQQRTDIILALKRLGVTVDE